LHDFHTGYSFLHKGIHIGNLRTNFLHLHFALKNLVITTKTSNNSSCKT
jgi:hypothetical protein